MIKLLAKWVVGVLTVSLIVGLWGWGYLPDVQVPEKQVADIPAARAGSTTIPPEIAKPTTIKATGTIEVAFSPKFGGADTIIRAINEAKKNVRVQAYSFTNAQIAKALLDAHKKGVDVRVILDSSQQTEKYSSATFFDNNKIPLRIDRGFAIAHSKIMIIDEETVITGSFNFTKSAEERNGENVLILRGNKELATLYLKNWQWRWDASTSYKRL